MFVDPGKALTQLLRISKKSASSYVVQIIVAFFLSGAFHILTLPRNVPELEFRRYGGFFFIHGLCVIIEVAAGSILNLAGWENLAAVWMRPFGKIARGAWALGVLYLTVPLIGSELVKVTVAADFRRVLLFPVPGKIVM